MSRIDRNTVTIARNARPTSHLAAHKAFPKSGTIRRSIIDLMERHGNPGFTDEEICHLLGIAGDSIRPSRGSLEKDGFIVDSGLTRMNKNKNACIIWVLNVGQGELF